MHTLHTQGYVVYVYTDTEKKKRDDLARSTECCIFRKRKISEKFSKTNC